ncbi:DUF3644 domain-containing protein [Mucilaginibacter sp. McL0603]|uniref:DUF3644 domain-containing protein n=1 Tax=Mucilaginibacter sp. McL0603 TaxID=3415670 RepID=UPI003CEF0750
MSALVDPLINNSKQALFAAIEIHNKPIFSYRYQVCSISLINAWELLLKAFIAAFRPDVKLILNDGSTKPFEECIACVKSSLDNSFLLEAESVERLYEYRCQYIHFYDDNINPVLYSLFAKSVQLYCRFLLRHFGIDLCEEANLILLPVGFKPPVSPIDFLSNKSNLKESSTAVREFISSVIVSTTKLKDEGIEEPILYTFTMSLVNEQRVKNADIVAALTKDKTLETVALENVLSNVRISNDESAKLIRVDEESLFRTVFTQSSKMVYKKACQIFSDLKQNRRYHDIMGLAKKDGNLYRIRYLDIQNPTGAGQGFYSEEIYSVLAKYYTKGKLQVAVEEAGPKSLEQQ